MKDSSTPFDSVESAVADIAKGKLVIVTDDRNRENEGDLVMAASKATTESVNMMIQNARGLICVPTTEHQLQRLGIGSMVQQNREAQRTDFTVSVDAAEGVTTGISAFDRATTIKILSNPRATPEMLVQPGHVFPLRARAGGVLERAGHTEASVDLAAMAGLHPSGVVCEILNEDGSCARLTQLTECKLKFGLKMISIADLIVYRYQRERLVDCIASRPFSSEYGEFELHLFRNYVDRRQHLALVMGPLDGRPTLVRMQRQNVLDDIFRSKGSSGHSNLERSLEMIARAGRGVVVYLEKPNSGIDLGETNQEGKAPEPPELRDYGIGAQILAELGVRKIRLLSTTQRNVIGLDGYGLEIVERLSLDGWGREDCGR